MLLQLVFPAKSRSAS